MYGFGIFTFIGKSGNDGHNLAANNCQLLVENPISCYFICFAVNKRTMNVYNYRWRLFCKRTGARKNDVALTLGEVSTPSYRAPVNLLWGHVRSEEQLAAHKQSPQPIPPSHSLSVPK